MKTPQTGYWTFFNNPKEWEIDKELKAAGEILSYRVSLSFLTQTVHIQLTGYSFFCVDRGFIDR
jgi:hypothetical protein